MPAEKCRACGSASVSAMFDTFTCLDCAAVSDYEGNVVSAGNGSATQPQATGDQFVSTETVGAAKKKK